MPVITGKDGRILIDGSQPGELLDWERTIEEALGIENSGQSDAWEYNEHVRKRWSVRARLEMPYTGYAPRGGWVGTLVAVVLKVQAADGGGFFAGTGRVMRDTVRGPVEDTDSLEIEIKGQGAPTTL